MSLSGIVDETTRVIARGVERAKKRTYAKELFEKSINNISAKDPCDYCRKASDEISNGDTIIVMKNKPKFICTDEWHGTLGEIEVIKLIDGIMIYLMYFELRNG